MIADWTVEVGPDSPLIDVPWEGWIDLRRDAPTSNRHSPAALHEAALYPELWKLLRYANNEDTFTSKSDVFPVSPEEVDPEIAEGGLAATAYGLGSYIDLLPVRPDTFSRFGMFEQTAKETTQLLSQAGEPQGVAEIVIRPARLYDEQTFGWTLYAMGFGPSAAAARLTWQRANALLVYQMHLSVTAASTGAATLSPGPQPRASSSIG